MNKITPIIIALLLLVSCKNDTNNTIDRKDYVITGSAKGIYNGIRVHLNTLDQRGRPMPKETAIVMDEKFTFNGALQNPELFYLTVNSVPGRLPVMLENAEMTLDIDKKIISNSVLKGSKTHDMMTEYTKKINDIKAKGRTIKQQISDAKFVNDSEKTKKLTEEFKNINDELVNYPFSFLEENNDNFYAIEILQSQLKNQNIDIARTLEAYNKLDDKIKNSNIGKTLGLKIDAIKTSIERSKATEIGKTAPNFTAPNPEGKPVSLNEALGKVTIVDFWAAWCGPCRRENPNVVKIYNKYHKDGLEIIGVSLDGTTRQKDAKKAWQDAIVKDKLTWTQVSNLKHFKDPIAQLYNIQSIPATFILDKDGKIVAKNLRGAALENKVKELLGK